MFRALNSRSELVVDFDCSVTLVTGQTLTAFTNVHVPVRWLCSGKKEKQLRECQSKYFASPKTRGRRYGPGALLLITRLPNYQFELEVNSLKLRTSIYISDSVSYRRMFQLEGNDSHLVLNYKNVHIFGKNIDY